MVRKAIRAQRRKYPFIDTILFVAGLSLFFGYLGTHMGVENMFSTLMHTAYGLLMETVFYIMAIAVLAGAFGKLASEFGLVDLLNKIFAPLMRPLYNLPGAAFIGIITTYLSDNPAIISLTKDREYLSYFKRNEVPCLCNLGTSFGMGLIVLTYMAGLGFGAAGVIGTVGAIIGSIVSVRLMRRQTKKILGEDKIEVSVDKDRVEEHIHEIVTVAEEDNSFFERFLSAFLEGGKFGVDIGLEIIPGVLIICTIVMMLTFGPADPAQGYQGLAYEGVALLPMIGEKISFILTPLFGFQSAEAIAFPITALGAVGAALSLVPKFIAEGIISGNEIAVFTAMGMCWSGFLSTHVAMLDALGYKKLISKAISSHLVGGLVAGVSAHYLFLLIGLL